MLLGDRTPITKKESLLVKITIVENSLPGEEEEGEDELVSSFCGVKAFDFVNVQYNPLC